MDKDGNVTLPNIELVDQYGKKHNLEDYKGKVVMINFWVSWCSDCKGEMPKVVELYKEYATILYTQKKFDEAIEFYEGFLWYLNKDELNNMYQCYKKLGKDKKADKLKQYYIDTM